MARSRTRHPWFGRTLVGVLLGSLCLVGAGAPARAPGVRSVALIGGPTRVHRSGPLLTSTDPAPGRRGPRRPPGSPPTATADPAAPPADPAGAIDPAAPPADPALPADPAATTDPALPADPAATTDPALPADPAATTDPAASTTPLPPPPAAQAALNQDCTLIVPPNPLSAAGLATPYRLTATNQGAGACHEANANQSAFVEAAILDPAAGRVTVYHPLVIDDGTQPAAPPVRVVLPPRAVVGVWFGFQANILSLHSKQFNRHFLRLRFSVGNLLGLGNGGGQCVNGSANSPFGQFAYCNAPAFFTAAKAAIRSGQLRVPPLGTARDGQPCPTTRDFSVVDQDQSDNLPTKYLALTDGRTAQFSPDNQARLAGATVLTNASDNGLLDGKIDPALGCQPFTAPDSSAGNTPSSALALNELQAAADQQAPVALVPPNDPMTQVNGANNTAKTNLYRAGVDMPPLNAGTETGLAYCKTLRRIAPVRLALDQPFFANAPSPDPAAGATLFDFLTQRLTASWTNLNCQGLTRQGPPTVGTTTAAQAIAPTTDPAAPTTDPAATDPAATVPPATDPAATDPAATDPAAGASATPDPAATDPAATVPPATDPAATDPAGTVARITAPAGTDQAAAAPPDTDPSAGAATSDPVAPPVRRVRPPRGETFTGAVPSVAPTP
jgi:hypothetical protein